jgi:hypothetical protein
MQRAFNAARVPVQLVVINWINTEHASASVYQGRALPYVQDLPTVGVARRWVVHSRDLVVCDRDGRMVERIPVPAFPLTVPANARALAARLRGLAVA